MTRPAFQFYTGDWRKNAKLRRCTHAERGAWIDILCLLHDADEYGILRWPLKEIANAAGAPMALVRGLVAKLVLKGCESGDCEPLIYTPKHARRAGTPVTLIEAQPGPIWYSSRFVTDEYLRTIRGAGTRFGESPKPAPKGGLGESFGAAPKRAPNPGQGDGASTSSSSSTTTYPARHTHHAPDSAGAAVCVEGRFEGHIDPPPGVDMAPAIAASIALRKRGMRINGHHPDLLAAIDEGVSLAELESMADAYPDKPAGYVIAAARRQHAQSPGEIHATAGRTDAGARESLVDRAAARMQRIAEAHGIDLD